MDKSKTGGNDVSASVSTPSALRKHDTLSTRKIPTQSELVLKMLTIKRDTKAGQFIVRLPSAKAIGGLSQPRMLTKSEIRYDLRKTKKSIADRAIFALNG